MNAAQSLESLRRIPENSLAEKRALIFTMDSIESYEKNSLVGGAAGMSVAVVNIFMFLVCDVCMYVCMYVCDVS